MSQENVERFARLTESLNRRDVEAALKDFDPAVELQSAVIGGAEGRTYRGHEGIREWLAAGDAIFEEFRTEPEEFRDLGDQVLMIGRAYARGRESGIELDSPIAWLGTLRGGKIVRARGYLDVSEALEAAGLSE